MLKQTTDAFFKSIYLHMFRGLIQLVLRLCAIIGGVFATSSFVLYTLSHIIAVLGSVNGLKS